MQENLTTQPCQPATMFPAMRRKRRAELTRTIRACNRSFNDVLAAVRREFVTLDWKQQSRASVASKITSAIQSVDSASVDVLNKATQTIIQEIYAIDRWPTSKRTVQSRTTAAIRRLKLGL